jgi:hypothetical protein
METLATEPADRIADLEAELRQRDAKIKELTTERDEAQELTGRMREHLEDAHQLIEQWIEAFDMEQDEHGAWSFGPAQTKLLDAHVALQEEHRKLIREWNKFVPEYNATVNPRPRGRPRGASVEQEKTILRLRKGNTSLRAIAAATGLSIRSVRTVLSGQQRTNALRRKEFARHRAAAYRVRQKSRDQLPGRVTELQKTGAALLKAAKGLGRV